MSQRKVTRYLEAKAVYDAYCRQRTQYPELTDAQSHPKHAREWREAKATWLSLMRGMTGGELATATRLERTPTRKEPDDV